MTQRDGTAILENVSPEGAELPGCQGRLQNPGRLCLLTRQHSERTRKLGLSSVPVLGCLPQHFPLVFPTCLLTPAQATPWKQAGSCFSSVQSGEMRGSGGLLLTSLWSSLISAAGIKSTVASSTSWMWMVTAPRR